jgi:hypothetical protein
LEKVIVKMTGRVEDLDADEAAVFPVERDEACSAGGHVGLDGGAASVLVTVSPLLTLSSWENRLTGQQRRSRLPS